MTDLKRDLLVAVTSLVAKHEIVNLVETGTGPHSSGLAIAKRLKLAAWSCDTFAPCVENARAEYPKAAVMQADSLTFLERILPEVEGPTLFWLDAHRPENREGEVAGAEFPFYDEVDLIKRYKREWERDVIWVDDVDLLRESHVTWVTGSVLRFEPRRIR